MILSLNKNKFSQATTHRSSARLREISQDLNKSMSREMVPRPTERLRTHSVTSSSNEWSAGDSEDAGAARRVDRSQRFEGEHTGPRGDGREECAVFTGSPGTR